MLLYLSLIVIEILMALVLRDSLGKRPRVIYYPAVIINIILSIWFWTLLVQIKSYKGFYDNPEHVRMLMSMAGTVCALIVPKVLLIILHFCGKLIRIKRGGHIRWLTNSGFIIASMIFIVLIISSLYGRFNFKVETLEIKIDGLHKDLDGFRIVQISDLHLASFYSHKKALANAMDKINALKPDLLVNTGDFVSYGWREYDSNDTILIKARGRYGNYAILGNHDFGVYHPWFTEADKRDNVLLVAKKAQESGYTVLRDTNTIVKIGDARLGLIGINTIGIFPVFKYGNLNKAMSGLGPCDLKILLSHDPNQWISEVAGKTDIDLTLSGHTHGMQVGIYTKNFRWSPAVRYYPHWNGLYREGKQLHYVNRGLGVLGIPFRVWMPPEITLIILKRG